MSKECPKCKGKLVFSDGAMEHEPRWGCINCDYEEVEEESKSEKVRALLKAIEDNTIDVKIDEKFDEEPVVPLQYIAEELEELKKC